MAVVIGLFIRFGPLPSSVPRKAGYAIVVGGVALLRSAHQQE
ncbi:hypothetical protein NIES4071_07790 [Calothrix sp. NIES-4071]|nr:hypothetical protein NIES4071_07790 [Calothrix sp. NIES-4071]BAZ55121.1 hypothetical protein NIES4105_07750 [Calothrix sp. NIES-4105]